MSSTGETLLRIGARFLAKGHSKQMRGTGSLLQQEKSQIDIGQAVEETCTKFKDLATSILVWTRSSVKVLIAS